MPEANPFQDPLRFERRVPPCAIVIFGANGDLTKRKLIPAFYRLAYERRLPSGFAIIGNSRTGMTDEAFREKMKEGVCRSSLEDTPFDERLWSDFAQNLSYFPGDLHDPETYTKLASPPRRSADSRGIQRTTFSSTCPLSRATTRLRSQGSATPKYSGVEAGGALWWRSRLVTICLRPAL